MFTVYALYSPSLDKLYIGQTADIERRLREHLGGVSSYTSRTKDWKLVYSEQCVNRSAAMRREKQLKSGGGKSFLRDYYRVTIDLSYRSLGFKLKVSLSADPSTGACSRTKRLQDILEGVS